MPQLPGLEGIEIKPFTPVAFYLSSMDQLHVHLRDCSAVEHWHKSGIWLLEDHGGERVGAVIDCFSHIVSWDVCDAIAKRHFPWWLTFFYRIFRWQKEFQIKRLLPNWAR